MVLEKQSMSYSWMLRERRVNNNIKNTTAAGHIRMFSKKKRMGASENSLRKYCSQLIPH